MRLGAAVAMAAAVCWPCAAQSGGGGGGVGGAGQGRPVHEVARPLGGPRVDAGGDRTALLQGGTREGAGGLVQTGLSLAVVLGLIFGLAAVARRVARKGGVAGLAAAMGPGGPSPAGLMEILGRYPVGRGVTLVLLRLDRRVLLLSQTAGGAGLRLRGGAGGAMTTLCEITDPEEVASILTKSQDAEQESMAARFRSLLTRFDARHEEKPEDGSTHLRAVRTGDDGDRVELWDDSPGDAVLSLKQRLSAARAGGGGR